jgi:hypothetical protein
VSERYGHLGRASLPNNILDRIEELERLLSDLVAYSALATADPESGEGATDDALTVAAHAGIGNFSPHHAPVTLGAGSDPALTLAGQALTLADVLTPTEHTLIGDGAPHHAPVTLAADADTLLGLTGQQITLDAQAANTALMGPTSGANADPTFRAIGATDLPTHAHTEADITDLDHTDDDAIHVNVANEIHGIDPKATPVGADEIVIEDSADGWAKKRVALDDLPGGGGASAFTDLTDTPTDYTGTAEWVKVNAARDGLEFGTPAGAGDLINPMTTAGDIIIGGASGAPLRLGIGTEGQVLTVASGVPVWATPSGGMSMFSEAESPSLESLAVTLTESAVEV